ncbi:Uncharacterised protein [Amycolatopsis camponoti]|uniref:Uncharacterized protein n=1 Tax=Amycolatopsis camponoti TaxID=2606593 RepID=A0A6I8M086_9PSEU|nr:Uncharacterised protein [Amycolatopsis camponoti]
MHSGYRGVAHGPAQSTRVIRRGRPSRRALRFRGFRRALPFRWFPLRRAHRLLLRFPGRPAGARFRSSTRTAARRCGCRSGGSRPGCHAGTGRRQSVDSRRPLLGTTAATSGAPRGRTTHAVG